MQSAVSEESSEPDDEAVRTEDEDKWLQRVQATSSYFAKIRAQQQPEIDSTPAPAQSSTQPTASQQSITQPQSQTTSLRTDDKNEAEPPENPGDDVLPRPSSWAQRNASRAASGSFSKVWDQLNSLDVALRDTRVCETDTVKSDNVAHQHPSEDDAPLGNLSVVTISGDVVGDYDVFPGMTVSTLRDKIALNRGELPFTLTLLWGTDVLDDAVELSEIVRQSAVGGTPLTLLHSVPDIGRGSFSKVWDTLGQLGTSLGSLERVASEVKVY